MTDKNRFEIPDLIEEQPDRWQGMKDKQEADRREIEYKARRIEDDKLPDGWPSRMEMIDALYRALGLPIDATRSPQWLWHRALEEVAALRLNDMLYPEARLKRPEVETYSIDIQPSDSGVTVVVKVPERETNT